MEKKSKFKLAIMAGVCISCIMVPASMAFSDYAEDLLVDSYYGDILDVVSRQDSLFDSEEDILITNNNGYEASDHYEDDILFSGTASEDDDIFVSSDNDNYGYREARDDDLFNDVAETEPSPSYDPSSIDPDILITRPVLTTPTPVPTTKPADSRTVKGAMAPVSDSSTGKEEDINADTNASNTSAINRVINAINEKRAAEGIAPVTVDSVLNYVADKRVKETTKKFSHTRPNGRDSATILNDYGVNAGRTGENIACCISSPEGVVSAWANSPSHRKCMLNSDYMYAGVGTVVSDGVTYWVLILTN